MSIHIGMLELQGVFPSLPSPPSEAEVVDAIERSSTDYKTFQALRLSARLGFSDQYPALKAWERDLISGLVNEPPLPKGPSNARDAQRNMLIVSQIRQLDVAGFKPMRNEATSARTSGCDIVADVMTDLGNPMTYSAVEAVWKNRDKAPQPKFLADLLVEGVLRKLPDQGEPTSEK
ncbi:hypothetical protein EV662_10596 [Rhodovulum marinum]|uniref:Uncharacterized protein n=2 Tax=Rhodovulum marinum TaxID=320662 RepID=A0A4R2PYV4_9RHOB|nr:hypothetical protein EV662_10596 [Rhodovulum marinum]